MVDHLRRTKPAWGNDPGWLKMALTTSRNGHELLSLLDTDHDFACPCTENQDGDVHVRTHCWRGECASGCQYCGLHVTGLDRATAAHAMSLLADDRHSAWTLVME